MGKQKKLSGEQLIKIITYALEQNKTLMQSPTMPAEAFPYYMEGKLIGYGTAIRKFEKNRGAMQNDIAEALAIIMRLKDAQQKPANGKMEIKH